MTTLLTIVHVVVCFFLIGIVLLQHGKGADAGAAFGGSSQTLFGTEGPVPLLNKITTLSAIVFMATSITLAYLSAHKSTGSVMKEVQVQEMQTPATEKPADKEPLTIPMATQQKATTETASKKTETKTPATEQSASSPATTQEKEQQ